MLGIMGVVIGEYNDMCFSLPELWSSICCMVSVMTKIGFVGGKTIGDVSEPIL